jgi:pentatricopeptide repeat protein
MQPDVVTFSTLIACCEKLGDVGRAEALWDAMHKLVSCQACLLTVV